MIDVPASEMIDDDPESPFVVIIIVNWNGKQLLRDCLDSLARHTTYPAFQIVVVDNGSSDGSAQMMRDSYQDVDLIINETNRGFSAANNQVFDRYSEVDYYLLLNNDIEVEQRGWLSALIDAAENRDTEIVGCRLNFADGRLQHGGGVIRPGHPPAENINDGNMRNHRKDITKEWHPDYMTGAALLIQGDVIKDIGGFDERFSPVYFEETDFCVRARKHGYNILYTPEVELIHHEGQSTESYPPCLYLNRLRFVILNFSITWLLYQALYEPRAALGMIYNGVNPLRVYATILSELPGLLAARRNRKLLP